MQAACFASAEPEPAAGTYTLVGQAWSASLPIMYGMRAAHR